MAIIIGKSALFGIQEILPLQGFPEGKKRIVMRPSEFIRVYVKTASGITGYYVEEKDGAWIPRGRFGENWRVD